MSDIVCRELICQAIKQMNQSTERITSCLMKLDEEDVWVSPNEHLNSIGNLVLHLCGNITQYIISSIGGAADIRERDLEFSIHSGYTKAELAAKLQDTAGHAVTIIQHITCEELLRERIAQGMKYSGIGIIVHVTEHYSYHTGQIILLTKLLKNTDLGFYAGIDLNKKNESF
jgi:uncharacterized damage-inducible protein DinB